VHNPYDELGQLAPFLTQLLPDSRILLRSFVVSQRRFPRLRTPLTALRAVGEAALRPDAGIQEPARRTFKYAEETRRLSDLVDALLLLARGRYRVIIASLEQVDLAEL